MKVRVNLTLGPKAVEKLDRMAGEAKRSRSNMVEALIWGEEKAPQLPRAGEDRKPGVAFPGDVTYEPCED